MPELLKNIKLITSFLLFLSFLLFNNSALLAYNKVTFFVVAHQDDWQLFMGDKAYNDIQDPENKIVIIYTTAGDAGAITPPFAYVTARQEGARNAVVFAADANRISFNSPETGKRDLNNKQIEYFSYKNTTSYFLRLPDGDIGQPGLTALFNNTVASNTIAAPATQYADWKDLVNTIRAIYTYEGNGITNSWLNCAETNSEVNPNDHKDHIKTSLAAQEAAKDLICNRNLYIEYYAAELKSNVTTNGLINKTALLAAYCSAMNQAGFFTNSWDSYHRAFLDKTYYRTVSCNHSSPELTIDQTFPNPFSKSTRLILEIPADGLVAIRLYAGTGQVVKAYEPLQLLAGKQSITINASDLPGPGIYLCTIEALGKTVTVKLVYN